MLKKGQVLGRAIIGKLGVVTLTGSELDWADMVCSGPRQRMECTTAPTHVRTAFYNEAVLGPGNTSLYDELDFLARVVSIARDADDD